MTIPFKILIALSVIFPVVTACSSSGRDVEVHAYKPFKVPASGNGGAYPGHVRSDVLSSRYGVSVAGTEVAAVCYDNTAFVDRGHSMDIARFSSDSDSPEIEISILEGEDIDSVTIHPAVFYPEDSYTVSEDGKKLKFRMSDSLRYAIVAINGSDPEDASADNPQLVLINDSLEDGALKPKPGDSNVLDFKSFADSYMKDHPIADREGDVCRVAGRVQDTSLNDGVMYEWGYGDGHFVAYDSKVVAFPDMRARNGNDISDALQAALQKIKDSPELNTLYIGPGVYLWSGLRIIDWNGDESKGGKPLYVYTDEDALMVNRLKECRESLEPAIFIKNSSFVTVSGRGMHDGQGCVTLHYDRKDARNTPHQGGAVVMKSNNITFNDTYMRDSQQWNWETHGARDVVYNNIKGLSPYHHAWIDGLNFASGKNITVNSSLTLGNDDTFATGHYNASDEFPRRTYTENPSLNLRNTDDNPEELRNTFAAAGIYNADRLLWDIDDSENIRISNAMGWTRTAHCIRAGANTAIGNDVNGGRGRRLKSYNFDNFHSVVGRKGGGTVRFQNGDHSCFPSYEDIVISNSSFWTPATSLLLIPTVEDKNHSIGSVALRDLHFVKPLATPSAKLRGIERLEMSNLFIGNQKIEGANSSFVTDSLNRVASFSNDFSPSSAASESPSQKLNRN